jgi:metal-sulfur cluster biosynthetic enzyme
MPSKERVIEMLKQVNDPEIPLNVYDLGFIYDINIDASKVKILMTLTVPGCPMHAVLSRLIEDKLREIEDVQEVEVELTFEPRWTIDKISEDGKAILRGYGYRI